MSGYAAAPLEDWLRDRYFAAEIDISGSGIQDYTLSEVLSVGGGRIEDLAGIVFRDAPSLGTDGLRAALADRFLPGRADAVMVTHGSSEAIYVVLNALLSAGDEVVIQRPAYHALATGAAFGARMWPWDMRSADGYVDNLDELLGLIRPGTRLVVVNFPHNPTGTTVTPDQQSALIRACAATGAWLIWDGAFTELVYDGPVLSAPTAEYERAVTFGTLSKAYGLPGLRVGWCLSAPALLDVCVRHRDYLTLAVSPLTQAIAEHAVRNGDALVGHRLEQARCNRSVLLGWLERERGRLIAGPPRGGVTAFPRLTDGVDVDAFARRLHEQHGVLTVPGSCFGAPEHVRIGFGGDSGALLEGLRRFSALLDDLPL